MAFSINPQLEQDSIFLDRWTLCDVRLINDQQYPWILLIPRREGVRDLHELTQEDYLQLMKESRRLSETMQTVFQSEKMNVAALGNVVPQLHLHHIARYQSDPAWPKPVWGVFPMQPYSNEQLQEIKEKLLPYLTS